MLNTIARIFLLFSQETILVLLALLIYKMHKRTFFYGVSLVFVSMLFNVALKVTFQIPLPPHIAQDWFAFPSGHMQTAVVAYGWLFLFSSCRLLRLCIITLLIGIGASLIHCGYHTPVDIYGALCFGGLLLTLYRFIEQQKNETLFRWVTALLGTICLLYTTIYYTYYGRLWIIYGALISILIAHYFMIERKTNVSKKSD